MDAVTDLRAQAGQLVALARQSGSGIATAESCTGGMIAAFITDVPGSSAVLERGFVTYSNAAKVELLGVEAVVIARDGAVCETVARQMAAGALRASHAEVAVAVTGIAGPGGGSVEKPVGLVHFAVARGDMIEHRAERFGDLGRDRIRLMSVAVAFDMLRSTLSRTA